MISVEAYVLAGGESSRMGQDKGMSLLRGKCMVQYTIDLLQSLNLPITILSSMPEYERFGYPVVSDLFPGKGPLGGLFTALQTTQTEQILVLSCDMPLLKRGVIRQLLCCESEAPIVHFRCGESKLPFPGRYHEKIMKTVLKNLKEENLSMRALLEEVNAQPISIGEDQLLHFANVNKPKDLEEMESVWFRSK